MENKQKMTRVAYQAKKRRKKRKLKRRVVFIFFLSFFSLFLFSSYKIISWYQDNQNIKQITTDISKVVTTKEKDTEGELVNPPEDKESDYWSYIKVPFLEVDFSKLKEKNQDTVAFIHVENTNINYPVVQSNNNTYYLNHAFDKSKNDAGWVFMDYRNQIQKFDNMVIYGHGRLGTTVFGSLKNILSKKWQNNKDNYIVKLSTPTTNMVFQIFSIYTIKAESYYIQTSFATIKEKEAFIQEMKKRNTAPIDVEVNASDQLITLSTCQNNNGGRIVVQAKLIKKEMR